MAKKQSKGLDDDEIIIGYNSKKTNNTPPQTKSNKNQKKKKNNKRKKSKWNKIKKILIALLKLILILAIIIGIGAFLFVSPVFNITEIIVENASKISENTYIVLSDIQIGENIFSISKTKITEAIKTESYVESVEIAREYPGTVVISVVERTAQYMIERSGGQYIYIDKNGYALEITSEALELPILTGITTDTDSLNPGDRIDEEDLSKFNDLIKITDGLKNNGIETNLTSIDISDEDSYVLEFSSESKTVILGDTSDLSTKMLWIKYFIQNKSGIAGTIHLDTTNVYFTPTNE